jgi:carbonic anhydrase
LEDVKRIREHPLVSKTVSVYGFVFDVKSGKLTEVTEASKAGKALV